MTDYKERLKRVAEAKRKQAFDKLWESIMAFDPINKKSCDNLVEALANTNLKVEDEDMAEGIEEAMDDDDDCDDDDSWVCDHCDCSTSDDPHTVIIQIQDSGLAAITEEWCQDCTDCACFYCNKSDELYSYGTFTEVVDTDQDNVCLEHVQALGWVAYDDEDGDEYWAPPPKNQAKTEGKMANYLDFYWRMNPDAKKGGRQLVVMNEEGDTPAGTSFEEAIYKKAAEAGADIGDPNALNVYTRLVLIENKILPDTYRL